MVLKGIIVFYFKRLGFFFMLDSIFFTWCKLSYYKINFMFQLSITKTVWNTLLHKTFQYVVFSFR